MDDIKDVAQLSDGLLYEYAVIRYVPSVEREEFINVGLLMMSKRNRWLRGRVHVDEQRLRAFSVAADVEALRRQLTLFECRDVPFRDIPVEEAYRWLAAVKSAVIQTSASHPGVLCHNAAAGDERRRLLDAEFDRLFHLLVK